MDLFRSAGTHRAFLAVSCALLCSVGHSTPIRFDLPSQSTATAIVAMAKQAGIEVLFSYRELSAVRSPALVGAFEPEVALTRLLEGTGFLATRNPSGKYTIVREAKRTGEIRGTIVSDIDNTPVAGAVVRFDGAVVGVRVGLNGRFALEQEPDALQLLIVKADGYRTRRIPGVQAPPGRKLDLGTVRLVPGVDDPPQLKEMVVNASTFADESEIVALQAVVVTPSRYQLAQERGTVAATLTESDLLALPQLGEDLYRAISHLPGLAADDFTAKFWVRGSPYDKVLARLDGVDLIEPFHLKDVDSTLSILDLETISRMDLYTGGYTVEYGNALAGVLTMETDRHVRSEPRTTLGLSLTGMRAATRGASQSGREHWLVSARTGYPALALEVTDSGNVIKPHYFDVYGKWEYDLTPRDTLSVHALHAGDTMNFREASGAVVNSRYASDYLWARWRGSFGDRLETETVVAGTELKWRRCASGTRNHFYAVALQDDRDLRRGTFRQDCTAEISDHALVRAGVEAATGRANYDYDASHEEPVVVGDTLVTQKPQSAGHVTPGGTSAGGYASVRVQPIQPLTLETGLRYDRDDYAGDADVSPRINAALTRGRSTLRLAWGQYAQAQGWHELSFGDGERSFRRAERAEHRIVSLERRLKSGVNLRLEGYERITRRPRPHWENVVDPVDVIGELSYDRMEIDPVRQRARGVELIAERRANSRFTWSAMYAFARSEETLRNGVTIRRARDQRHTIYLDASYTPNDRWQFTAAWQYHTGWPATPVDFTATQLGNGTVVVFGVPGRLYSTQLPDYHRLDFRLQRRLPLQHGQLRLYLDVFNAYARRNSIGYQYTVTVTGSQSIHVTRENDHSLFPMLPSVGAVWDF